MSKKTILFFMMLLLCTALTAWTQRGQGKPYTFLAIDYDNEKLMEIGLDGQVKRTVAVGKEPHEVQIDARTGRAFVTNTTEPTISVIDIATFKQLEQMKSPYFGDAAKTALPQPSDKVFSDR